MKHPLLKRTYTLQKDCMDVTCTIKKTNKKTHEKEAGI